MAADEGPGTTGLTENSEMLGPSGLNKLLHVGTSTAFDL